MFDASEQLMISSSSSSRTPPPLPFPLSFDVHYTPHLIHFQPLDLEINNNIDRSEPWSPDEVLALLRVRSTLETWFPHFTWDHVSRKLAELGFKRSAEKCKERFQEETTGLNHMGYTKNFMSFQSELDQLYHNTHVPPQKKPANDNDDEEEEDKIGTSTDPHEQEQEQEGGDGDEKVVKEAIVVKKKRKREDNKFEVLKGFCEDLVMKMVAQHEEMHLKLIQDMVKRDEESLCKEESWKQQEMDRINKELDIRAQQHSIACLNQASIIDFLNNYTPTSTSLHQIPNPTLASQSESKPVDKNSSLTQKCAANASRGSDTMSEDQKDETNKRWPKDEVLALISLRASLNNNVEDSEGETRREGLKGPLWERMSQGMRELGYKRSAKRCKEKWENINKYFRKTKNGNKKRSLESRTCPYFHQLSALYNQGTLVRTSSSPENHSSSPEDGNKVEKDMVQTDDGMGYV